MSPIAVLLVTLVLSSLICAIFWYAWKHHGPRLGRKRTTGEFDQISEKIDNKIATGQTRKVQ